MITAPRPVVGPPAPVAAPRAATADAAPVTTPTTTLGSDALLVKLAAKPNLRDFGRLPRGPERKAAVWNALVSTAQASQVDVLAAVRQLQAAGVVTSWETLVAPNMVLVTPAAGKRASVLQQLAAIGGVKTVYDNDASPIAGAGFPGAAASAGAGAAATAGGLHHVSSGLDVFSRGPVLGAAEVAAEPTTPYGVELVGAPAAWAVGADGHGLVYGSIDTGVDRTHEALASKYRGLQADGTINDDYSWFDIGRTPSPVPVDPGAHGTHTIGTVLGGTGELHLGVAPAAKFISAHGIDDNADSRLKALQFMQAPTKRDGTAPDPRVAPDVVGMSWWTGPNWSDFFGDSLDDLIAAGIEPVKSAGNNGPGPETGSAPGVFPQIEAIAAVDADSQIASFSSRGPSPLPHARTTPFPKPDFSAPGVDTFSAIPGNRYEKMSGTSMAQPHFSGVVLDLLSAYPQLSHSQIDLVLAQSATDLGAKGRDLEFGAGLVNLPRALDAAAALLGVPKKTPPAGTDAADVTDTVASAAPVAAAPAGASSTAAVVG